MSINKSEQSLEKKFMNEIKNMKRLIEEMRSNQQKFFIIPQLAADPTTPAEGQIWQNTTTDLFKIRLNGVTKTVTVS